MQKHFSGHIADLKHLWHTVFGDAPSVIDAYFDIFYSPDRVACEFIDGELAAAAYVMPAGELTAGDTKEKCAHIYAVAVYPKFRGRGLGISVTNRAVQLAKENGFNTVVLHPASDSLFDYYKKHCGFETCFYSKTETMPLGAVNEASLCTDINSYITCREKFLSSIPHISLNEEILTFFVNCGGKLYASDFGCAAVEVSDGTAYFREALGDVSSICPEDAENASLSLVGCDIPTGMIHGSAEFKFGWMGLTLA